MINFYIVEKALAIYKPEEIWLLLGYYTILGPQCVFAKDLHKKQANKDIQRLIRVLDNLRNLGFSRIYQFLLIFDLEL